VCAISGGECCSGGQRVTLREDDAYGDKDREKGSRMGWWMLGNAFILWPGIWQWGSEIAEGGEGFLRGRGGSESMHRGVEAFQHCRSFERKDPGVGGLAWGPLNGFWLMKGPELGDYCGGVS